MKRLISSTPQPSPGAMSAALSSAAAATCSAPNGPRASPQPPHAHGAPSKPPPRRTETAERVVSSSFSSFSTDFNGLSTIFIGFPQRLGDVRAAFDSFSLNSAGGSWAPARRASLLASSSFRTCSGITTYHLYGHAMHAYMHYIIFYILL